MNPRTSVLTDEFTAKRAFLDGLDQAAADEHRDLSDTERADYEAAVTRMEQIETDLGEISKRQARFDAVAEATTRATPIAARTAPRVEVPSFGEQLLVRARASLGNLGVSKFASDVTQAETLTRALQHGTSADGISPVTIEGDLINFVDANRYAVNASRRLPIPDNHSLTWKRPRTTQHTQVAAQGDEGTVLASRTMTVTGDTVTKAMYGGVLALSEVEIDNTDPAMLALAVQDLAEQYGIVTDTVLTAAIEAGVTTNKTILSLTATPTQLIAGVSTASAAVYSASKKLADTFFVAPDRWAYLTSLVDGNGRPLFPVAAVQNSAGTNSAGVTSFAGMNILGLNVVVDPNFSSNTWVVGASQLVEFYEQDKGLLTIAAPSTLETQIAYRGYVATNVYAAGLNGFKVS